MKKKACSYIQFSSPQQLKDDSLHRQLETGCTYAEAHNMILDSYYTSIS